MGANAQFIRRNNLALLKVEGLSFFSSRQPPNSGTLCIYFHTVKDELNSGGGQLVLSLLDSMRLINSDIPGHHQHMPVLCTVVTAIPGRICVGSDGSPQVDISRCAPDNARVIRSDYAAMAGLKNCLSITSTDPVYHRMPLSLWRYIN
jgi:hypothetical protein